MHKEITIDGVVYVQKLAPKPAAPKFKVGDMVQTKYVRHPIDSGPQPRQIGKVVAATVEPDGLTVTVDFGTVEWCFTQRGDSVLTINPAISLLTKYVS